MAKKTQREKKSEDVKEFRRAMIDRLKNPGNSTLRSVKIMFRDSQFYYSI